MSRDCSRWDGWSLTADMLGDAYEYLIKQFADVAGKKGGEFYMLAPIQN